MRKGVKMGLSASQARVLLLTARKSDLEFKAQQITHRKTLLAMQTEEVATNYSDALNNTRLYFTYATKKNEGNTLTELLTYEGVTSASNFRRYRIVDASGNICVTDEELYTIDHIPVQSKYATYSWETNEAYRNEEGNMVDSAGTAIQLKVDEETKKQSYVYEDGSAVPLEKLAKVQHTSHSRPTGYDELKPSIPDKNRYKSTWSDVLKNPEGLQNALRAGMLYIEEFVEGGVDNQTQNGGTNYWNKISIEGNEVISTKYYTEDDRKAEATYNRKTLELQNADKRLDVELQQIQTQQKACESEMDSVKQLITKSIDSTYKIFGNS